MAANFEELIAQAAGAEARMRAEDRISLSEAKQAALTQTIEEKKQELDPNYYQVAAGMNNDLGAQTMTGTEKDLRTLTTPQFLSKYGPAAANIIKQYSEANQSFLQDSTTNRTFGQRAWDDASGLAAVVPNGVAGITAVGSALTNKGVEALTGFDLGLDTFATHLARGNNAFNEAVYNTQSDAVNADRRISEALSALGSRDSEAQWKKDIMESDSNTELVWDGLKQIATDTGNTLDNLSAVGAEQLIAEATGSLLTAGPTAKIVGKVGQAAVDKLAKHSITAGRTAHKIEDAVRWPTAVALLEGGGTYTSTSNEVMSLPIETLRANPGFNESVSALMVEDPSLTQDAAETQARIQFASDLASEAALRQMPVAAVVGTLTRGMEKPFSPGSKTAALSNAIAETGEESFQGGTSQVLTNQALLELDPTRTLQKDVGKQVATGAVGGLGSAGVVQGPRLAAKGASAAAKGTFGAVVWAIDRAATSRELVEEAKLDAETIQTTQAFTQNLDENITNVNTAIDATEAAPEEKEAAKQKVSSLVQSLKIDPESPIVKTLDYVDQSVRDVVVNSPNRLEAILNLAQMYLKVQKTDDAQALTIASTIHHLLADFDNLQDENNNALGSLSKDDPLAVAYLEQAEKLANFRQAPTIQRILSRVQKLAEEQAKLEAPSEEVLASPEGQVQIQNAVAIAELTPETGNLQTVERILNMAGKKRIQLTEQQRAALEVSKTLLTQAAELAALKEKLGTKKLRDVVTGNIVTDMHLQNDLDINDGRQVQKKSAAEFAKLIASARRAGNNKLAAQYLDEFRAFVEHMQNKLNTYNKHYNENGAKGIFGANGYDYLALMPFNPQEKSDRISGRIFKNAMEVGLQGIYVAPNSKQSVETAQSVGIEAEILSKVFNGFVEAYPDLGIAPVPAVSLVPALQGKAEDVVEKHKALNKAGNKPVEKTQETSPRAVELLVRLKAVSEQIPAAVKGVTKLIEEGKLDQAEKWIEQGEERAAIAASKEVVSEASGVSEDDVGMRDDVPPPTDEDVVSAPNYDENQQDEVEPEESFNEPETPSLVPAPTIPDQTEPMLKPETFKVVPKLVDGKPLKLNNGQRNAFQAAMAFLKNKSKQTFAIIGSAGTGKTTIVDTVLASLKDNGIEGRKVVLSAPTHRANAVTRSKNDPSVPVITLHALLGIRPVDEVVVGPQGKTTNVGNLNEDFLSDNTLLIIDESSMITDELYESLEEAMKRFPGMKVIFLGDLAQLMPVQTKMEIVKKDGTKLTRKRKDGSETTIFYDQGEARNLAKINKAKIVNLENTESKALHNENVEKVELTKVERANNANLLTESIMVRLKYAFTAVNRMLGNSGVKFLNNSEEYINKAIEFFKSEEFKQNPLLVRLVSHKNSEVAENNKRIREALFGKNPPDFVVGDLLMGYGTIGKADKVTRLSAVNNGLDYIIEKVSAPRTLELFNPTLFPDVKNPSTVKIQVVDLVVQDVLKLQGPQKITLALPTQDAEVMNQLITKLVLLDDSSYTKGGGGSQFRQLIQDELYSIGWTKDIETTKPNPFDKNAPAWKVKVIKKVVDYGYSHTIHKSQGGTYKYVFVNDSSINPKLQDAKKLRYVGLTRAKEGAFVLTNQQIREGELIPDDKKATPEPETVTADPSVVAEQEQTPSEPTAEQTPILNTETQTLVTPTVATEVSTPAAQPTQPAVAQTAPKEPVTEDPIEAEDIADDGLDQTISNDERNVFSEWFPNLLRTVTNRFLEVFKFPDNDQNPFRMSGLASPLAYVKDALSSAERFNTLTEDRVKVLPTEFARKGYVKLLGDYFEPIKQQLEKSLTAALDKDRSTKTEKRPTWREQLLNGTLTANTYRSGKALNLVDHNKETGEVTYNTELMEQGVLAALQWLIESSSRDSPVRDEDIEGITGGTSIDEMNEADVLLIKGSLDDGQIINAIANKMKQFWGVRSSKDSLIGYADGIPQAFAANIMDAMIKNGILEKIVIEVPGSSVKVVRYVLNPIENNEGVKSYPNLLNALLTTEKEEVNYLGDDLPPVAETQMNNPSVRNTAKQKAAIEKQQQTQFFLNMPMLNLFYSLGSDGLTTLFGGGPDLENNRFFNKNHKKSLEGKNKTVSSAFQRLEDLLIHMEARAKADGKPLTELAVRFAVNASKNGRLMMLGSHNPQASKIMRAALTATWSTLNFANPKHVDYFDLAKAQALDLKVHKYKKLSVLKADLQKRLDALQEAQDILKDWMSLNKLGDTPTEQDLTGLDVTRLKEVFSEKGVALTPNALHALVEHVRHELEGKPDNFRTSLALEADGVTNGPINAMMLITLGAFTPEFIKNVRRGGIAFGVTPTAYGELDNDADLYQAAANATTEALENLSDALKFDESEGGELTKHHDLAKALLSMMLPDFKLTADADGNPVLEIKRGLVKNPLTITIYGSSANGIAGKITGMVIDSIYEKTSAALQAMDKDRRLTFAEAFFPGHPNPEAQFAKFQEAMKTLTGMQLKYEYIQNEKRSRYFLVPTEVKTREHHLNEDYTVTDAEFKVLRENLKMHIVNPMVTGIYNTLGTGVRDAVGSLKTATQVHSNIYATLFMQAFKERIAERKAQAEAEGTSFSNSDLVTKKDLDAIRRKLAPFAPLLKAGPQEMMLSGNQMLDTDYLIGATFDDALRTVPNLLLPGDLGVGGIPNTVIGYGDAYTVLHATLNSSIERALWVFDGVELPLDQVEAFSEMLNKSVMASYKQNPFADLYRMFSGLMNNKLQVKLLIESELAAFAEKIHYMRSFQKELSKLKKANKAALEKGTIKESHLNKLAREAVAKAGIPMPADKTGIYDSLPAKNIDQLAKFSPLLNSLVRTLNHKEFNYYEISLVDENGKPLNISSMLVSRLEGIQDNLKDHATDVDARHQAMSEIPTSIDQLASARAPAHNGVEGGVNTADGVLPPTDEAVAQTLEKRRVELLQKQKPTQAPKAKNGATVVDITSFYPYYRNIRKKLNAAQAAFYDTIFKMTSLNGYKIIAGTLEEIQNYQHVNGMKILTLGDLQTIHGQIDLNNQTIFLIKDANGNVNPETALHELVHAATYMLLEQFYTNPKKMSQEARIAVQNLERLMLDFLKLGAPDNASEALLDALEDASAEILSHNSLEMDDDGNFSINSSATPQQKAAALNEFMAWGLSNKSLVESLGQTASPILTIIKKMLGYFKQLFGYHFNDPKVSFFDNLVFNANIVAQEQTTLRNLRSKIKLNHATNNKNLNFTRISEMLDRNVINQVDKLNRTKQQVGNNPASEEMLLGAEVAMEVAKEFDLSIEEQGVFGMFVLSMTTQGKLDANVLVRVQELYNHVMKNVTPETFEDPSIVDPQVRYTKALQQYNILAGKSRHYDKASRSTMLSTFLGLAVVSPQFRSLISNIQPPTVSKVPGNTLDGKLENLANEAMEGLSKFLANEKNPTNVRNAIDQLVEQLYNVTFKEKTQIELGVAKVGTLFNNAEERFVAEKDKLAAKAGVLSRNLKKENNRFKKTAGILIGELAALASQEEGNKRAESVISLMNRANLKGHVERFVVDMLGRTGTNASVYDLIKPARAFVQQLRQQFRDHVPSYIAKKFSRKLTDAEYAAMFRAFGKSDVAVFDSATAMSVLSSEQTRQDMIASLEEQIQAAYPNNWLLYQKKMKQLANYMNTENPGVNLLRNANAIAHLYGEGAVRTQNPTPAFIAQIDKLTTLYAIEGLSQQDKDTVLSLVQTEKDGVNFIVDYLIGQRKDEMGKVTDVTLNNQFKGHIPSDPQFGGELIVADDRKAAELAKFGFKRIGKYTGSSLDNSRSSRSYYLSPVSRQRAVSQGIIQNVNHTVSGVDAHFGFSTGKTAGRITNPIVVQKIAQRSRTDTATKENLMPVFDVGGKVIGYERSLDPEMLKNLDRSEHIGKMIGVWRGRQAEEFMSVQVNTALINAIGDMWDKAQSSPGSMKEFVNISDLSQLTTVERDAVALMSQTVKQGLAARFGNDGVYIRRDMLIDVIGYRNASVGDFFTGNTEWSSTTQTAVQKTMLAFGGNKAFQYAVAGEQRIQSFMMDARQTIVVKSVVIPMYNIMSNMLHLVSRGVPVQLITKGSLSKLSEINHYARQRVRQTELEAEIRASKDDIQTRKLQAELQTILDGYAHMSIWPLIAAGEFSSIADVGITSEDVELTSGKLSEWVENKIDKLPPALQTAARYGYVSRHTALFQGLQKAVQYGDFVAKAVMYDHLVQNKGKTPKEALAQITEEFVNYDRLPGRGRGALENMGLLWFYNYKIRTMKVALSVMRNNPLHALLAMSLPLPDSAGLPIEDNLVSVAAEGNMPYSMGPGMALHAINLNPWVNLMN